MDRMIYLSMSAARATMQRQEVLAHNLANVSTNGFRAELAAFRAVPVRGDGASTRVYALETTVGHDTSPGVVQSTGRDLDVAVRGRSWLAVQAFDGTEAYTRAGALQVDAEGASFVTLVDRVDGDPDQPMTSEAVLNKAVGLIAASVSSVDASAYSRRWLEASYDTPVRTLLDLTT